MTVDSLNSDYPLNLCLHASLINCMEGNCKLKTEKVMAAQIEHIVSLSFPEMFLSILANPNVCCSYTGFETNHEVLTGKI